MLIDVDLVAVACKEVPRAIEIRPSAFNRQFFSNGKLWAVPGTVVALQALVVHWAPARANFDTEVLSAQDWWLAFAVTYSILLLDEGRKLILKLLQRSHRKPT